MMVMLADSLVRRLSSASKVPTDADDACWWSLPRKGFGSKLPADADDACR